jgi:hypothetical protein
MISEYDIRQKMADVLSREISIPDFVRWILLNDWNMHQDSSFRAVDLVSEIHLLLDQRDEFLLDDAAFIRELDTLNKSLDIKIVNVSQADSPQIVVSFKAAPSRPMFLSASA